MSQTMHLGMGEGTPSKLSRPTVQGSTDQSLEPWKLQLSVTMTSIAFTEEKAGANVKCMGKKLKMKLNIQRGE